MRIMPHRSSQVPLASLPSKAVQSQFADPCARFHLARQLDKAAHKAALAPKQNQKDVVRTDCPAFSRLRSGVCLKLGILIEHAQGEIRRKIAEQATIQTFEPQGPTEGRTK